MFNLGRLAFFFAIVSLSAVNSPLTAWDGCCYEQPSCNRLYIGGFGGGIYSDSEEVSQYGTAFFSELKSIGPLSVIAKGHLNKTSTGFGGVQIGYEWFQPLCSGWAIAPAVELEAFFFNHKKKGHLINQTVIGLPEHDFADSFHMDSTVVLANVVLSIENDCLWGLIPYVGGGIGATRVSIHKADSFQVEPVERGINHFNSDRSDSNWTFAAQVKAGLRYTFCQNFHVFAEYRYLYVDESDYVLGATNYTTHVPTSPWNVKVKDVHYNAFAIGVQFDFSLLGF
jgi:opacity protein-like surface antigen